MSTARKMQDNVNDVFKRAFGRTPLQQRVDDILKEATELARFTDIQNLREESGDLLATLLALMNEMEWQAPEVLQECLTKIERRIEQYRKLGRKYVVAILGGAFDPVTAGHVRLAKYVQDSCGIFDEVWLMPCYSHMDNKQMTEGHHRLNMCRLAIEGFRGTLGACPYEIDQKLAGETYHLVKTLMEEDFAKHNYDFSFIIGMDNANTFSRWVNFRELERLTRFVVVPRPGVDPDPEVDWYHKSPHICVSASDRLVQTSSTLVRSMLYNGQWDMVKGHLDPKVVEYIRENGLYTKKEQQKEI